MAVSETLEIDPPDDPELFDAAVVLVASTSVGCNADRIAKFTGLHRDKVRPICRRLRDNGVWTKEHHFNIEWFDEETGNIAFTLDCLIAQGKVVKVDGDKYDTA
jgi:hypothetical protein